MTKGITVVFVYGRTDQPLTTAGPVPDYETTELDCHMFADDRDLAKAFAATTPQSIVTFGDLGQYPNLHAAPFYIRKRWIHIASPSFAGAGEAAFQCFLADALRKPAEQPAVVSVITPTYRIGERILRPYHSLLAQSYPEWEWVIIDDSDDGGKTWRRLRELAQNDYRITLYQQHRHSGNIGELKNKLGHLAQGDIILELDHDDELTEHALAWTVQAFRRFPEAGFAYSNWAEVFEDRGNATYPEGWGFGYGGSHVEWYRGRQYIVQDAPRINSKTIRHIVSAPNHLRAWRRDFYLAVGGHNRKLHVADDFELCIRTFLHTRMVHIPKLGYIQYYNTSGNTQRLRNKEIQRLVRSIAGFHDQRIHERFLELGVDDFCWNQQTQCADMARPNPESESHASLICADSSEP